MWLLYDLTIFLYGLAIRLAAWFNPKAKLWVQGRRKQLDSWTVGQLGKNGQQSAVSSQQSFINQQSAISNQQSCLAWFHCASLGEFEQGRPVIEAFRSSHPDWKILLTFFSPSGYEIRKNYEGADLIVYLPLDTKKNARRFIDTYRPELAVFIKYEFWFRYIDRLHSRKVPLFLVSGIFRPRQRFFRWHGGWARRQLGKFSHFFVQDEPSATLLQGIGIRQVTVSGDTRFDRVAAIADHAREFPLVEKFAGKSKVILAGSTWPADEGLILELMKEMDPVVKFIIAPHEVAPQRIEALCKEVISRQSSVVSPERSEGSDCVLFSQLNPENAATARVLVVDGIGYLSSLYQYATLAYIGGGFGVGIHNILEAATFGKPVLFGPNYGKFREAVELVQLGGVFPVKNDRELAGICSRLLSDTGAYTQASELCTDYVRKNRGATKIIMEGIEEYMTAR